MVLSDQVHAALPKQLSLNEFRQLQIRRSDGTINF